MVFKQKKVHSISLLITMDSINKVDDDTKLHIVMFPWLAFGHMIPYLELAKLIAQKGHRVSFISTPKNIHRLPKTLIPLIDFIELPLPQVQNLPEGSEATIDLPVEQVSLLKVAYDGLQDSITNFLKSSNPDWLLYDFVPYWVPAIARSLGIPTAFFSIFIGACLSFLGPTSQEVPPDDRKQPEDYTVPPKWVPFQTSIAYRLFEVRRVYHRITGDDTNVSDFFRFMEAIRGCDLIALRSSEEFEPEWLLLLEEIHRKPVLTVGLLSPAPVNDDENSEKWQEVKVWLGRQPKGSVVYVAFGSEAVPSQDEITEIALGLEQSGLPFFWVLRSTSGSEREVMTLPEGFEERVGERGVVCRSWAPQVNILGHDSVGVFLSHSGWSSVVEALTFGRPLVLLTMSNDQGLNARFFEEKGVGYSIPREENDGSFRREAVAESLRMVVEKEEGRVYREKAKELKAVFGDRDRQDVCVNNFLEYLKTHRRQGFKKAQYVNGVNGN